MSHSLLRYSPYKDALNFTPALDHYMAEMYYPLAPHFNLLQLDKPYEISKNASMTDSVVASTSEWLSSQRARFEAKRASRQIAL